MAFLCGKNHDDDGGDECEPDEQPTLPSWVHQVAPTESWPDRYSVDAIIRQAYRRYLDRERRVSSLELCPVCWRYARARGVADDTISVYPRPCPWHAQAIIESEPATRVWLIQQYRESLMAYLWPPSLRQEVERWRDGADDGSADDGWK